MRPVCEALVCEIPEVAKSAACAFETRCVVPPAGVIQFRLMDFCNYDFIKLPKNISGTYFA
jgi:hypothetical protein